MDITEKRSGTTRIFAALTALNIAVIWFGSILSSDASSAQSAFIASLLGSIFPNVGLDVIEFTVRKCAHFAEFACFGTMASLLTYSVCAFDFRRMWSNMPAPVIGCLLVASTDEMIQVFTGRGNSVFDVLLDFCGSLTAMCVVTLALFIKYRRGGRRDVENDGGAAEEPSKETSETL